MPVHKVFLELPSTCEETETHLLGEALMDVAISTTALRKERKHTGSWALEWLLEAPPDRLDILSRLELQIAAHEIENIHIASNDILIEELPEENWLKKSYRDFPPFSIGPFFLHGSHFDGEIPDEQIPLKIDAATAFGSGEHGTTKGCLQAMIELKAKGICPWNVLDMGTGSGILALAAWKLWKTPILAVDNDPESIRVTESHAEINGVALGKSRLSCACGDGFNTPEVDQSKPYELIIANILAGPVIEMAPALCRVLDDNSYCILSGMLNEQADLVTSAYEGEGLTLKKRYDIGEWTTLVMHKD